MAASNTRIKFSRATLIVSCVALVLGWTSSGDPQPLAGVAESQGGHLAEITARGKLVMLCYPLLTSSFVRPKLDALRDLGIPLWELRDPKHFEGSDVELMRDFAESLGVKLEIRPITTSYADLIQALPAGYGDVIASSITITEERKKLVDFSNPYSKSWVAVVVHEERRVASVEDLAGLTGALMKGSSQLEFLRAVGPDDVEVLLTNFSGENYEAVDLGNADFTLVDSRADVGTVPNPSFPSLRIAFRLREFSYGVVVPPGSDLLKPLNVFLAKRNAVEE